jgi:single-strand DNA-binding protein
VSLIYLLLFDHYKEPGAVSFNRIVIIGNLTRDPELRYTPGGNAVCSFSVATNEWRKLRGESVEITTYFRCTAWSQKAEFASKYLAKGQPVYIEGRLRLEEYTNREGNKRQSLEVNVSDFHLLPTGNGDSSDTRSARASDRGESELGDDDVPF